MDDKTKSFAKDNLIAITNAYKNGSLNIEEASNSVSQLTELQPEIVQCFLKAMKRSNVKILHTKEIS